MYYATWKEVLIIGTHQLHSRHLVTWPSDTKQDLNGHNAIGPVQLLSLYEECNKDKFWQRAKGMLPTMSCVNTLVL